MLVGIADDGHARCIRPLGFADSERDDIDIEPAKEGCDAREDAGLVFD
jgi:hypothetical protein